LQAHIISGIQALDRKRGLTAAYQIIRMIDAQLGLNLMQWPAAVLLFIEDLIGPGRG
jgi:hypothetical protein